jgi:hypothetical protein
MSERPAADRVSTPDTIQKHQHLRRLRNLRLLYLRLSDEALGEVLIGVDPAVAEKRPVRPAEFHPSQVAIREDDFFACDRGALHDCAVG